LLPILTYVIHISHYLTIKDDYGLTVPLLVVGGDKKGTQCLGVNWVTKVKVKSQSYVTTDG
jgi:hypothetical protein